MSKTWVDAWIIIYEPATSQATLLHLLFLRRPTFALRLQPSLRQRLVELHPRPGNGEMTDSPKVRPGWHVVRVLAGDHEDVLLLS